MVVISETLYYGVCALPVLGFVLGALWMRQRVRTPPVRHPQEVTPVPVVRPEVESQLFDVLDSVQAQLAELAERQDFTERLMTRDSRELRQHGDTPVPTPV